MLGEFAEGIKKVSCDIWSGGRAEAGGVCERER